MDEQDQEIGGSEVGVKDFKKNGMIISNWIVKRYEGNRDKLYPTHDTSFFTKGIDKEVL